MTSGEGREWFREWFGEEYLRLYQHRDRSDARRLVELIDLLFPVSGRRVLDLACGPGRHAHEFIVRGARVTGVDLSATLLNLAQRDSDRDLRLVRADMRYLPFGRASFDGVANLFTSFGYFESDAEHAHVLSTVRQLIRPAGWFVLDFLNSRHVVQSLVPHEESQSADGVVEIRRHISADGRFVVKSIRKAELQREFIERVRLFSPDELASLLAGAGFSIVARHGDYRGGPLGPESPRAIYFCRVT